MSVGGNESGGGLSQPLGDLLPPAATIGGQNTTQRSEPPIPLPANSGQANPNPLVDVFRMAMTSFFSSSLMTNMNSTNMGCVDPNDVTLAKYAQVSHKRLNSRMF